MKGHHYRTMSLLACVLIWVGVAVFVAEMMQ